MKKIISLVIFTAALAWSWNLIHSSQAVGFETHSGIQEKLAILIKQTVMAKKPNAKNFKITRLWTEALSETKVRAVFAYIFSESTESGDNTDQAVEGEAILFREPKDESKLDKWKLQSVKTTGDAVSFTDAMIVTPNSDVDTGNIVDPDPGLKAPAESETK